MGGLASLVGQGANKATTAALVTGQDLIRINTKKKTPKPVDNE
jgi:hypothetical protein